MGKLGFYFYFSKRIIFDIFSLPFTMRKGQKRRFVTPNKKVSSFSRLFKYNYRAFSSEKKKIHSEMMFFFEPSDLYSLNIKLFEPNNKIARKTK